MPWVVGGGVCSWVCSGWWSPVVPGPIRWGGVMGMRFLVLPGGWLLGLRFLFRLAVTEWSSGGCVSRPGRIYGGRGWLRG